MEKNPEIQRGSLPLFVAHRGAKKEAPENTAAAYSKALKYPIYGIELDVQLSKDHVPVIYHDRTMWKINRRRKRLKDYNYDTLSKMDFGRWHSNAFTGEKLLTLQETLRQFFHKTNLFIELKSRGWDRRAGTSHILTDIVTAKLKKTQQQFKSAEVFILSFDRKVLDRAMRYEPHWNYILNLPTPGHCTPSDFQRFGNIYGFCTNINRVTQAFAQEVHKNGLKLLVYSCNTPGQVVTGFRLGVDVMMTDDPGWLFEYLKRGKNV